MRKKHLTFVIHIARRYGTMPDLMHGNFTTWKSDHISNIKHILGFSLYKHTQLFGVSVDVHSRLFLDLKHCPFLSPRTYIRCVCGRRKNYEKQKKLPAVAYRNRPTSSTIKLLAVSATSSYQLPAFTAFEVLLQKLTPIPLGCQQNLQKCLCVSNRRRMLEGRKAESPS